MDQENQTPASEPMGGITINHFSAKHRLHLTPGERMAVGEELSQLVKELKLPLIKVRERVFRKQWALVRVYPESLLNDWLARYTEGKATTVVTAVTEGLSEPQPTAANGGLPPAESLPARLCISLPESSDRV